MTEGFWEAVAHGDLDDAKAHSTELDLRRLTRLAEQHAIEGVEIGEVLTRGDVAEVATTLRRAEDEAITFHTQLRRYDAGWRVDAPSSATALREAIAEEALSDLRDAFSEGAGAIGEAVEQGLEEATDAMREALDGLERGRQERRSPAP